MSTTRSRFLQAAIDWVAANTERDVETRYLEATVTYWHNDDAPEVVVLRSPDRPVYTLTATAARRAGS